MNALNLLSLRGLAKRLNLDPSTAKYYRRIGLLQPDFESDNELLFLPERLDALHDAVRLHREPQAQL